MGSKLMGESHAGEPKYVETGLREKRKSIRENIKESKAHSKNV